MVERSLDPTEEDQVSSYLPRERRVRRLSAEERADKFMGSNFTLDDFEAFSGRVSILYRQSGTRASRFLWWRPIASGRATGWAGSYRAV